MIVGLIIIGIGLAATLLAISLCVVAARADRHAAAAEAVRVRSVRQEAQVRAWQAPASGNVEWTARRV